MGSDGGVSRPRIHSGGPVCHILEDRSLFLIGTVKQQTFGAKQNVIQFVQADTTRHALNRGMVFVAMSLPQSAGTFHHHRPVRREVKSTSVPYRILQGMSLKLNRPVRERCILMKDADGSAAIAFGQSQQSIQHIRMRPANPQQQTDGGVIL